MIAKLIAPLLVVSATLSAQWPTYRPASVPKTTDGKVNLEASAPRANGKPDLSGVWEFARQPLPGPPPGTPPAPQLGSLGLGPRPQNGSQFWNIGATLKDGLPFTPWAKDLHAQRMVENSKDNPDAHCLPIGLMQLHTHPQPRKIVQNPDVTIIMYEANSGLRQIFTDGRKLPPADVQPWWYGYSVGRWEGDTFVVETNGFRDDVWLDVDGSPLTSTGKMTERYRRPKYGNLEIDITVEDPKAYTKPWTVRVNQKLLPDEDLIEFVCGENEKSVSHLVGK